MLQRFIRSVFIRSWWVMAFILIGSIIFEQGLKQREDIYQQLTEQFITLQKDLNNALLQQEDLQLQINSQSDLAWVELTLMKGLGLVPEGQQKVYFFHDERCSARRS